MYTASFILASASTEIGKIEGSLSDQILCFNRPVLPRGSGYFYDLLRVDPSDIINTQILVTNPASQTYGTMYIKPSSFRLLFETRLLGSVANSFLRIWLPVPPEGFTALGLCVSTTDSPPDNFYCIRSELTAQPQEDDINSFAFLILRSPVTANLSLIRSNYLSFSVNSYLPVLHPMFLLSLQRQILTKDIPIISQLFDYLPKPKSRRVDPAVDKHILLKLTIYRIMSDAGPKSSHSISIPKIGTSRSTRLPSASMTGGMNMSRFSKSGFTSRLVDDAPDIDDDLTTIYLVKPAQGPRLGDSISTKNSVVPRDSILALLSQQNDSEHSSAVPSTITHELVHEIFAPSIGFSLVGVMPSSFAPPEKRNTTGAVDANGSSVSCTSESTALNETYTLDENRATAHRASREPQVVKYTYLYAPIAPKGYTAVSVVLGDDTGEPPDPSSILTVNSKYVVYTDAFSVIGELYDKQSAEYCYAYLKTQNRMLEERRKMATLCFPGDRNDINTADRFARPILVDVPLPPPSYSSHSGSGAEHGVIATHKAPESPLRNNEHAISSSDPSTEAATRTGTAFSGHQDAVRSCVTSDSRMEIKSATLSDLSAITDLDKIVRPTARAVQLVTPRGSPFIFVNDSGPDNEECTRLEPPKFPTISPAILNFVFSPISTSSKDFTSGIMTAQDYVKKASLNLSTHKLQFVEPNLRKPSYSCFGSIVHWNRQVATNAQILRPPTPQQAPVKTASNQRSGSTKGTQQKQEAEQPPAIVQVNRVVPEPTMLPPELGLVSKSSGFDSYVFSEPDALIPIWSSDDLETDNKIVIYEMVPQLGYAALGHVVSLSSEVPRKSRYCCVSLAFVSRATAVCVDSGVHLPIVAGFDKQHLIAPRCPYLSRSLSDKDNCGMAYFNLRHFNDLSGGFVGLNTPAISSTVWIIKDQLLKAISNQQQPKIGEHTEHSNLNSQVEAFGATPMSLELVFELSRDATSQVIIDERFDCGSSRDNPLALLLQEISEMKRPGLLLAAKSITTAAATTINNQSVTESSTTKAYKERQASRGGVEGASKLPRSTSGKRPDGLPPPSAPEPTTLQEKAKEDNPMKQCMITIIDPRWLTFGTRHVSALLDLIPVVKNTLPDAVTTASNGLFARPADVRYLATVQIGSIQCLVFKPTPLPNYVSLGDIVIPAQLLATAQTLSSAHNAVPTTGATPKSSQEQSIRSIITVLQKCLLCVHLSFCEYITLQTVQPAGHDLAPILSPAAIAFESQTRTMLSGTSCLTDTSKQRSGQAVSSTKTSLRPSDSAKNSALNVTTLGDVPAVKTEGSIQQCPRSVPFVGLSQENVENVRSNSGRFTPSRSKSRACACMRKQCDFLGLYDDIDLPEIENLAIEPPRPNTRGNNALILQQAQDLRCCFDIGHAEQYLPQEIDIQLGLSSDLYTDSTCCGGLPGHSVSTSALTILADGYREDGGNGCWVYSDGVHLFASLSPRKELNIPRIKAVYLNQLSRKLLLSKEDELNLLKSKERDQTIKDQADRTELTSFKGASKTFSITKRHGSEHTPLGLLDCSIDTPYDGIYYWMDPLPAYALLCTCLTANGKPSKDIGLETAVRDFDEETQKGLVSACMVSISSLHVVSYEQPLNAEKLLGGCPPPQPHDGARKAKQSDAKKPTRQSGSIIHKNVVINTPASRLDDAPDHMQPSVDLENLTTKHSANAHLLRTLFGICDILHAAEQFKVMGRDTILSFRAPHGYVLVSDKVPVVRTKEAARPAFLGFEEGDVIPGWYLIFEKALARCAGSYAGLYSMAPVELVLLVFQFIGFVPCKAEANGHGIKVYYTSSEASLVNFSPESAELLLEPKTI